MDSFLNQLQREMAIGKPNYGHAETNITAVLCDTMRQTMFLKYRQAQDPETSKRAYRRTLWQKTLYEHGESTVNRLHGGDLQCYIATETLPWQPHVSMAVVVTMTVTW